MDGVDPVAFTTGHLALDVFIAFVSAMATSKGTHMAWRKYANGKTSAVEGVSKKDMEEVMSPLLETMTEHRKEALDGNNQIGRLATVLEERLPPAWARRNLDGS